jgi:hypothetical protein
VSPTTFAVDCLGFSASLTFGAAGVREGKSKCESGEEGGKSHVGFS